MPTHSLQLILKALSFAARKHRDQRRKDDNGSPYINHPIALANVLCLEAGIDDAETLCAALLHDTVEDTDTSPQELEALFGEVIRDIVMEVTDDKRLPKRERKRMQIVHAAGASPQAQLVKLAFATSVTVPPTVGTWRASNSISTGPGRSWINCAASTRPWKPFSTRLTENAPRGKRRGVRGFLKTAYFVDLAQHFSDKIGLIM